ncbi:hypothetical protein B0H15DRAFT_293530 [Mycena belliarum]|uniref:DUF7223 domain-containing protein n=1 Tax=Mycena belliarum TaxID=1033014 RepID=A0AAD6U3F4_9AGAR|nr:hypothetical protein B0H15DRAFT_293530 [Mycena belliae]
MLFPALRLVLAFSLVATGQAANDWSTPCFNGQCSYDIPATSEVSGTLRVWGPPGAISDITSAAGWTILDCDKGALAQDVRLVCHDSAGCPHLTDTTGAAGKLVRLPESCGQSAFARVSRNWVHANQTLPPALARRLQRRDGELPSVQGLSIDANFDSASQAGTVNFAIHALTSSVPARAAPQRRSRFASALHTVDDRSVISVLQQAFQEFNSFNQSTMQKLQGVNIKKTFPLFDEKISCPAAGKLPGFEASVSGAVDMCAVVNVTLAVTAVGTLLPANFTKFGIVVGLDANLEGTLKLSSSASATLDSGKIDLFTLGIPGLDFPGILTIGPSFKVAGEVSGKLDVDVDLAVDLSYCISGAKLFYPPSPYHNNSGKFTPNNSPLNMSVSAGLASSATVAAHIIPTLDFGVTAIGGVASADIFVDFDTSSTLTLALDGAASASGNASTKGAGVTGTSASLDGCVDIGAGLAINAGANGKFFGLFDFAPQVNLFTKNFDFFKKCFGVKTGSGNSTKKARELDSVSLSDFESGVELPRPRRRGLAKRASALSCPASGTTSAKVVKVADAVVSSASIKVKG